jgi:hypothetical protein
VGLEADVRKFSMKRIAAIMLLAALTVPWSLPAEAQQHMSVAEYERQSQVSAKRQQKAARKAAKQQRKMFKKANKQQRKAMKQYAKSQRRSARRSNHRII